MCLEVEQDPPRKSDVGYPLSWACGGGETEAGSGWQSSSERRISIQRYTGRALDVHFELIVILALYL